MNERKQRSSATPDAPPTLNPSASNSTTKGGSHGPLSPEDPQFIERLAPNLNLLPPEEREFVVEMIEQSVTHTGPIPPPSFMAAYSEIYPESPKLFFDFADRQIQTMEARVKADIDGEADYRNKNQTYRITGMLVGALVSISLIAAGTIVAVFGNAPLTGGFVSIVGVGAGLAGVFVQGRPLMDHARRTDAPAEEPKPSSRQMQRNTAVAAKNGRSRRQKRS